MKILSKYIDYKSNQFVVRIQLQINTDDCWNLYNLMNLGDMIKSLAWRKITKENQIGTISNQKKKFQCVLKINSFEFDSEADLIRISGQNASENKYLKLGQYQSIEISPPKIITLVKTQFDSIHIKQLKDADTLNEKEGIICAVVMEEGMCHIFQVGRNQSRLKQKIEKRISKKKQFNQQHEKQKNKFFDQVSQAIMCHFKEFALQMKCLVIGSPGFVKDQFFKYIQEEIQLKQNTFYKQNLDKIVLAHTSSGFKHSLTELLQNKSVQLQMQNVKIYNETKVIDEFFEQLSIDQNKVCYGPRSVEYALENMAIQTLLISDKLFRAKNVDQRKYYVKMIERAEQNGIGCIVFSSMNLSGERLDGLSGVAAILRYPLPEIDDIEEEDYSDQEEQMIVIEEEKKDDNFKLPIEHQQIFDALMKTDEGNFDEDY